MRKSHDMTISELMKEIERTGLFEYYTDFCYKLKSNSNILLFISYDLSLNSQITWQIKNKGVDSFEEVLKEADDFSRRALLYHLNLFV